MSLHAVGIPGSARRGLRERCAEFFTRIGRRLTEPMIAAQISQDTWNLAVQRCGDLLNTQEDPVLLHGDLHMGNVLDGGRSQGWVAIDPKACVGDRCFDAVDYVLAGAGREGVDIRCALVAGECGMDGDRLYAWCRVVAPVTAIAYLAVGSTDPAVVELLALAR